MKACFEAPDPEHVDYRRGRGSVAWFPVHCTSINNTNDLISGDNKGVAAQLFKRWAGSQVLHSLLPFHTFHPGQGRQLAGQALESHLCRLSASAASCFVLGRPACTSGTSIVLVAAKWQRGGLAALP